ncbi:uncharacterized protein [Palaemon carinicauda]|uniref:uncharacterized protein n=1 Tax=Palaemon carinicauda TaxID=392227 RepID=UPI0035B5ECFE
MSTSTTSIINEEMQMEDNSPGPSKEKSSPLYEKWKIIAIVSGIIALLLAVGLSATLGIFLTKTECGSPPKHNLATTDYLGSAAAGSKVSYVCPSPYVFPDDNNTFVVSCSNNLEWDTDEIPPCARQAKKTCKDLAQEENFSLSAYIEDQVTRLEVKLMFTGDVPDTFMVDLDSKEDRCEANENLQNRRLSSFANSQRNASTLNRQGLREDTQVVHMIMRGAVQDLAPISTTNSPTDASDVTPFIALALSGSLFSVCAFSRIYLGFIS